MPSASRIPYSVFPPVPNLTWIALIVGVVFSIPLPVPLRRSLDTATQKHAVLFTWVRNAILVILFIAGSAAQTGASYQPFIYGEF
ncbi:MAG: hypothetical protein FJZ98_00750 [Chloroflexi bacterium]|nr:hypothetical protein [Chloroflexota bacterium]